MLPPATEQVWNFVKEEPALAGFILVGGSALALRIQHRLSEDLDLIFLGPTLPIPRLDVFSRVAKTAGFDFAPNDNEAAIEDFASGGLELHDYQQDFLVNASVKVSFFTANSAQKKILLEENHIKVRTATLPELFKSKALISALRSKTRDWFDLYLLMRDHGFTIHDYRDAFQTAEVASQCDIGLARLCSGAPQKDDEGYAHLLSNPPTLEEIKSFFVQQRDLLEIETAAERARLKKEPTI